MGVGGHTGDLMRGGVGVKDRMENTVSSDAVNLGSRLQAITKAFNVSLAISEQAFKELEDAPRPDRSTAGAATFRYDSSLIRVVNPTGESEPAQVWFSQGRDAALEQRILDHVSARLSGVGAPVPVSGGSRGPLGLRGPAVGPETHVVYRAQSPDCDDETCQGDARSDCDALPDEGELCGTPGCGLRGLFAGGSCGWSSGCGRLGSGCGCLDRLIHSPVFQETLTDSYFDWINMYGTPQNLGLILLGVGAAAVMANTGIDEHFQHWHDESVKGLPSGRFADVVRELGTGLYIVPAVSLAAVLGPYCRYECGTWLGTWGQRCLRSYVVGAPMVLALQLGLGASRPDESDAHSYWKPFTDDNSVSGHAFIGSVPFIQAAMLTDNFWARLAIFVASTFTGWSRINDDAHYLSQSFLGWWIGLVACTAVDQTDTCKQTFLVAPLVSSEATGLAMTYRW